MMLDPDGWVYMVLCPELRRLETSQQRREAVHRTKVAIAKSPWFIVQFVGFLVLAMMGYKVLKWAVLPDVVHLVLYTLGVMMAYILVFSWTYCRKVRELVRRELNRQGIRVCIYCGYDIRGQMGARCPECGRDFDQPE